MTEKRECAADLFSGYWGSRPVLSSDPSPEPNLLFRLPLVLGICFPNPQEGCVAYIGGGEEEKSHSRSGNPYGYGYGFYLPIFSLTLLLWQGLTAESCKALGVFSDQGFSQPGTSRIQSKARLSSRVPTMLHFNSCHLVENSISGSQGLALHISTLCAFPFWNLIPEHLHQTTLCNSAPFDFQLAPLELDLNVPLTGFLTSVSPTNKTDDPWSSTSWWYDTRWVLTQYCVKP